MRPCSRANPTIGNKFSGMDGLDDLFALLFSLTKIFSTDVERGKSFMHISTSWFTKKSDLMRVKKVCLHDTSVKLIVHCN